MKALALAAAVLALSPLLFAAEAPPPQASMDDAAVAGLLRTANDAEIDAAKMAVSKGMSPKVKAFAKMMIADHRKNNMEVEAWLKAHGREARDSEASTSLRQDAQKQSAQLMALKGADFDAAYVEQQVKAHQMVLESIDRALASTERQDPSFSALLRKTAGAVSRHLQKAQKLQSQNAK